MASRTVVVINDDLDGSVITDDARVVNFSVNGVMYRLDLSAANADKFEKDLKRYIDKAQRVGKISTPTAKDASNVVTSLKGRRSGTNPGKVDKEQATAIRDWARKQGKAISDRGKIPDAIKAEYETAHTRKQAKAANA